MGHTGVAGLQYDVLPYRDRLPEEASAAWAQVLDPQAPVFLHPEWLAMAIEARAVERGMVVIFRDGSGPRAVVPFQYRTHWSAEISAPLAPDITPFIIAPGVEEALWPALAEWFRRSPFSLLRLGRYPRERFDLFRRLTEAEGLMPICRQTELSMWAALPDSWDGYLKGLSKASRYKVRHAEDKILADFPAAQVSLHQDPAAGARDVEELIRLSLLRWSGEKRRSFLENPHMAVLLRRFTLWAVEQGWGCVATLRIGDRTVAVATGIHVPGQPLAFYHVVGRDPAALPHQYSPGMLLAGRIIRWAIERGAARISLGQGSWPYKLVLGGEECPQWELCIARSALAARTLAKIDPAIRLMHLHAVRLLGRTGR